MIYLFIFIKVTDQLILIFLIWFKLMFFAWFKIGHSSTDNDAFSHDNRPTGIKYMLIALHSYATPEITHSLFISSAHYKEITFRNQFYFSEKNTKKLKFFSLNGTHEMALTSPELVFSCYYSCIWFKWPSQSLAWTRLFNTQQFL